MHHPHTSIVRHQSEHRLTSAAWLRLLGVGVQPPLSSVLAVLELELNGARQQHSCSACSLVQPSVSFFC